MEIITVPRAPNPIVIIIFCVFFLVAVYYSYYVSKNKKYEGRWIYDSNDGEKIELKFVLRGNYMDVFSGKKKVGFVKVDGDTATVQIGDSKMTFIVTPQLWTSGHLKLRKVL